MLVRFSQKWAKEKYEPIVREAIRFVKGSRSCKDLLVKVMFYTKPKNDWAGNYRSLWLHGFYDSEFELNRKLQNPVDHIITLKIPTERNYDLSVYEVGDDIVFDGMSFSEAEIQRTVVRAFAHEFKHYLDMRKLRSKGKWRHWEDRAKKFAEKILDKWNQQN